MKKKLISIIVPVLNEKLNILPFYNSIKPILNSLKDSYDFEILFTDNHSQDETFEIISSLINQDNRIRIIRLSKNYGYQKSILTGYSNCKGDAAIQLDCDLQDPPSLIIEFIKFWQNGYKVVYGIRKKTKDNLLMRACRKFFYRLINYLSEEQLPLDAGDFRLIDRQVINILKNIDDSHPYLRGIIASIGLKQIGIPYQRAARLNGKTNFKVKDLFRLAIDGISSHSVIPLRLATFFGLFVSGFTLLLAFAYLVGKIFFQVKWPSGFTTLAMLTLFGISINALFLGIIGEYVGRIFQHNKKRPIIIEREYHLEDSNKKYHNEPMDT